MKLEEALVLFRKKGSIRRQSWPPGESICVDEETGYGTYYNANDPYGWSPELPVMDGEDILAEDWEHV